LTHIRFTPGEYRLIDDCCRRGRLGERHQPAFRRLLVESLRAPSPALACRVARLGRGEVALLYRHFHPGPPAPAGPELTAEEMRTLAAACLNAPFHVRFARAFKRLLVEMLEGPQPRLAHKVARMSGHQFERLYEQLSQRGRHLAD